MLRLQCYQQPITISLALTTGKARNGNHCNICNIESVTPENRERNQCDIPLMAGMRLPMGHLTADENRPCSPLPDEISNLNTVRLKSYLIPDGQSMRRMKLKENWVEYKK